MKVKVIRKFRDKETKIVHKAGEVLILSKKRFAEIQKAGSFVEEVEVTDKGAADEASAEGQGGTE
ncbi:MAG: hypothetical protein LIO86_15385 [Lachnospiraceae bacterium]|nr:hypothetical protein [Lachnospiraceae bacterium]